jgi:hypothetical protein
VGSISLVFFLHIANRFLSFLPELVANMEQLLFLSFFSHSLLLALVFAHSGCKSRAANLDQIMPET